MATRYIGASIKRKEDYRFLTGAGNYTDDVALPRQTHAHFVRSPHAHAKIKSIRKDKALKAPGVVAIFTGDDLAGAKVNGLPCGWLITDVNGQPMKEPPHPCLAQGKARYVGDHVAVVIADTYQQARDAAELIKVEYEELPAVVRAAAARKKGAPVVHDIAPDNTCYVWGLGDKAAVDKAFSDAHGRDHVTKAELAHDKDGKFLAMRVTTTANMGAYLSTFASCIPTILYATLLAGQYTTPAIYAEVTAVFTNTAPVDAYRGAGRPEATYVVERIVHQAATEMGSPQ